MPFNIASRLDFIRPSGSERTSQITLPRKTLHLKIAFCSEIFSYFAKLLATLRIRHHHRSLTIFFIHNKIRLKPFIHTPHA